MASRVVDGARIPLSLDDQPVFDFCNTRAGWRSAAPREYLVDYSTLAIWARESGILQPSRLPTLRRSARLAPVSADRVVSRTIAYREALYDVLVGSGTDSAWAVLAVESANAAAAVRLQPGVPATWPLPKSVGLALPLLSVVREADSLLGSPGTRSVRACPMPDCGWLFSDPRGRRRWCSMALCGNRAKARRFARRAAEPVAGTS